MEGAPGARAWKGVWICAAIWLDPDLSWIEKALLAEIDCLVSEQAPCHASNEHLAQRMGVSVSRVNDMLARLQSAGFVVRVQYDGRVTHRVVSPKYSSNPETAREWINASAKKQSSRKRESRLPENRNSEFLKTGKQTSAKQEDRLPENRAAYIEQKTEQNTDRQRTKTTTTTHEENKPIGPSSSPSSYGSVSGRGREESASLPVSKSAGDDPYSPQYPAQDDVPPIGREGTQPAFAQHADRVTRTRRPAADRESPHDGTALGLELAKEFGLSRKQRRTVSEYCRTHGEEYVATKAELVRSAPRRNAAGALLAALREDWQPPVIVGMGDSKANDELAQRMGWEL